MIDESPKPDQPIAPQPAPTPAEPLAASEQPVEAEAPSEAPPEAVADLLAEAVLHEQPQATQPAETEAAAQEQEPEPVAVEPRAETEPPAAVADLLAEAVVSPEPEAAPEPHQQEPLPTADAAPTPQIESPEMQAVEAAAAPDETLPEPPADEVAAEPEAPAEASQPVEASTASETVESTTVELPDSSADDDQSAAERSEEFTVTPDSEIANADAQLASQKEADAAIEQHPAEALETEPGTPAEVPPQAASAAPQVPEAAPSEVAGPIGEHQVEALEPEPGTPAEERPEAASAPPQAAAEALELGAAIEEHQEEAQEPEPGTPAEVRPEAASAPPQAAAEALEPGAAIEEHQEEAQEPEPGTPAEVRPEAASAPPQVAAPQVVQVPQHREAIKKEDGPDTLPISVFVNEVYEGPFDLLLDLIRKQDIDIYDIPIARITAQFLAYVNKLKASDMDVAGEFIYTASLLIHIKSKMLLPRNPAGPGEEAEDPRRELVERLLEHERFKNAAQMLQQKQMLESASWTNPGLRDFRDDAGADPEIAADTVDLVRIFREILERARSRPVLNVQEDSVTVGQMIQFLGRRLTMEDKPVALRRLLAHTKSERALIAMFLALLELVRLQAILLRQDRHFSEIFVKKNSGFDAVINDGLARDDWQ